MIKEKKCPLCHLEIYSDLSKGCKLCGMALQDESKEFCSQECRLKYVKITSSPASMES